jgi:pterin-4a-carbinolamine dehydratase
MNHLYLVAERNSPTPEGANNMTDPREKLSATQVGEASLADWRQILGRIKARFRTGDFRTGLALVNKIGAAAEAANHHPDIQLMYSDVIVTLASHDVRGITSRDLDLARQISNHAAELGIDSDASGSPSWSSDSIRHSGPSSGRSMQPCSAARWKRASRST